MSQKSFMLKKKKKLLRRFWDWPFLPLKVDTADDDADDDGQVGIWKAPLPLGTAELKVQKVCHDVKNYVMKSKSM